MTGGSAAGDVMELRHEAGRKAIHLSLAVLPVAAWMVSQSFPTEAKVGLALLAGFAAVFDVARRRPGPIHDLTRASVGPLMRPDEAHKVLGSTLYLAALALSFLLFPRSLALAAMGFLVIGDTAAALAGRALGRSRLRPGKTLEGTVACLIGCLAVTGVVKALEPALGLPVLASGALAATAAELLTNGDRDNLAMPLISGVAMLLTGRTF